MISRPLPDYHVVSYGRPDDREELPYVCEWFEKDKQNRARKWITCANVKEGDVLFVYFSGEAVDSGQHGHLRGVKGFWFVVEATSPAILYEEMRLTWKTGSTTPLQADQVGSQRRPRKQKFYRATVSLEPFKRFLLDTPITLDLIRDRPALDGSVLSSRAGISNGSKTSLPAAFGLALAQLVADKNPRLANNRAYRSLVGLD